MKMLLIASGLVLSLALPASAQDRDSDGDVVSVTAGGWTLIRRGDDGSVFIEIHSEADAGDAHTPSSADPIRASGDAVAKPNARPGGTTQSALPKQVSYKGALYDVHTADGRTVLRASNSRVNPKVFGLD